MGGRQEVLLRVPQLAEQAGGRSFENLSPDHVAANAETWEAAISKLRGGSCRPQAAASRRQPSLGSCAGSRPKSTPRPTSRRPGRVSLHRLNRREYAHAIRDLLALDVDPSEWLPQDNVKGHFDNNADALQGRPHSSRNTSTPRARSRKKPSATQGLPIATTYGDPAAMVISLPPKARRERAANRSTCPACRSARAAAWSWSTTSRPTASTSSRSATWRSRAKCRAWSSRIPSSCCSMARSSTARTSAARKITRRSTRRSIPQSKRSTTACEDPLPRDGRPAKLAVTFCTEASPRATSESARRARGRARTNSGRARAQIRGPLTVTGMGESASRAKIFVCQPTEVPARSCATEIVTNLAERAFRRPLEQADLSALMAFYDAGSREGGFETGVRDALSAILASPSFIYRAESGQAVGIGRAERPRARLATLVLPVEQRARRRAAEGR